MFSSLEKLYCLTILKAKDFTLQMKVHLEPRRLAAMILLAPHPPGEQIKDFDIIVSPIFGKRST